MKIPTPSHSISQGQNLDSIKHENDEKSDNISQIEPKRVRITSYNVCYTKLLRLKIGGLS